MTEKQIIGQLESGLEFLLNPPWVKGWEEDEIETCEKYKEEKMTKQEEIREGFARFLFELSEHDEWYCAKNYDDVKDKGFWLWFANEHLKYLHSQGVVIRVNGKLPLAPKPIFGAGYNAIKIYDLAQKDMTKAGYVAVEPLVKGNETLTT